MKCMVMGCDGKVVITDNDQGYCASCYRKRMERRQNRELMVQEKRAEATTPPEAEPVAD